MSRWTRQILRVMVLVTLILCGAGSTGRSGGTRQERCKDGNYAAVICGHYAGQGTAVVSASSVSMNIEVRNSAGQVGRLQGDFPVSGPYFGGRGTIMRDNVTVRGRLDAAKASRVVATFWDDSGHSGRLVATLPSDTPDESWDRDPGN